MESSSWYSKLIKPSWAPPSWLFGPVWTFLYILIAISYGKVFILTSQKEISWDITIFFVLNLLFNFAFTPLQFKLKSNFLASIDIVLVLITLVWSMFSIFSYVPWIAYINFPYLIWVLFATVLQLTLTYINRRSKISNKAS